MRSFVLFAALLANAPVTNLDDTVAPPSWIDNRTVNAIEGRNIPLAWRWLPGTAATELLVGHADDHAVARPIRVLRVEDERTHLVDLPAGVYQVRLGAVDSQGTRGALGPTRQIVVWPALPGVIVESDVFVMSMPGVFRLRAPPRHRIQFGNQRATATATAALFEAGAHRRRVTLTSTGGYIRMQGSLRFEVPGVDFAVAAIVVAPHHKRTHPAAVYFHATTAGRPVSDLQLVAERLPANTSRLVTTTTIAPFRSCFCSPPSDGHAVRSLGDGVYRADLTLEPLRSSTAVRIVDTTGTVAVELHIPAPPASSPAPGRIAVEEAGWFAGVSGGAMLGGDDAPRFRLSGEVGRRLNIVGPLAVDLSAHLGWFRRTTADGGIDVFPLVGRAALDWVIGAPRVYVGVGLGLRVSSGPGDAALAGQSFAGLGYRLGTYGEVIVEGGFESAGEHPSVDGSLSGFQMVVGFRVGTWRH